jgi:hypothetical protein
MRMIREAVSQRFGDGVKAERVAVYITAQLVTINSAALGRLFNRDVPSTLRACTMWANAANKTDAFAAQIAGVQEAITDRLAALIGRKTASR